MTPTNALSKLVLVALLGVFTCACADKAQELPGLDSGTPAAVAPEVQAPVAPALEGTEPLADLVATPAGDPVLFRPAKEGQWKYQVELRQKAATLFPGRKPMVADISQTFVLTLAVKPLEDGKLEARYGIENMKIVPLGPDGKPAEGSFERIQQFSAALQGVSAVRKLDPQTGAVLDFQVESKGALAPGVKEIFSQLLRDLTYSWPADPKKPGETWDSGLEDKQARAGGDSVIKISATTTFVGATSLEGVPCLLLRTQGTLDEVGTLKRQGILGSTRGAGNLQKAVVLDPAGGLIIKLAARSTMTRNTIFAKAGDSMGHQEDLALTLNATLLDTAKEAANGGK
jgi:hypothetical protein